MGAAEARLTGRANLARMVAIGTLGKYKDQTKVIRAADQSEGGKIVGVDPSVITARRCSRAPKAYGFTTPDLY